MENNFEKIGHKNDLNYQNFGGKMATKKEYDRYKDSIKFFSFRSSKTDSPNGLAENMFRAEGGRSGKIGIFKAITQNRRIVTRAPIGFVRKRMPEIAEDLRSVMEQITPDQKFTDGTIPGLKNIANSLSKDNLEKLMEDIPFDSEELKQTKPDDLIRYRSIFTDVINNVNTLLFKYYHNDKRIQKEALYIINMANYGINAIDEAYEDAGARDEDSDIGSLTGDFTGSEYTFNYTDSKGSNRTIDMTPSRYEAWI